MFRFFLLIVSDDGIGLVLFLTFFADEFALRIQRGNAASANGAAFVHLMQRIAEIAVFGIVKA